MKKLLILLLALVSCFAFSQQITNVEYFFDEDPGYGLGQSISITASEDIEIDEMIDINELAPGMHTLFMRVLNESEEWSPVYSQAFFIDTHYGVTPEITHVEYFIDTDPGYGNAIPYNDFESTTNLSELFFANMTNVDPGSHNFSIRVKNEINQWSQNLSQNFELINCDLGISGMITNQSESPITTGYVVLFQSFGEGSALGVDTIYLSNGSYEFSSVCPNSNYYIKVFPEYPNDFLATYYGDSPYWQNASLIATSQSSMNNINIITSDFLDIDIGNSSLGGHIYQASSKGEPIKNIDVVLEYDDEMEKGEYFAVAASKSNEIGVWEINDLPSGNFRIKVEVPGLEMDTTYYVEITSPNTNNNNLDYYIDFNTGIFIDHFGIEEIPASSSISIFPNPTHTSSIWLNAENDGIEIQQITIYNYNGQEVKNQTLSGSQNKVELNELSKGFYLVKVQTNKGLVIEKIIIQ